MAEGCLHVGGWHRVNSAFLHSCVYMCMGVVCMLIQVFIMRACMQI